MQEWVIQMPILVFPSLHLKYFRINFFVTSVFIVSNVSFRFQFQNNGFCLFSPKDSRVPRVVVPLKECPEGKVNGRTTYKCVNTFVHACMYHVQYASKKPVRICAQNRVAAVHISSRITLRTPTHVDRTVLAQPSVHRERRAAKAWCVVQQ